MRPSRELSTEYGCHEPGTGRIQGSRSRHWQNIGVTNQALVEYRGHEPGTGRIQVSRTRHWQVIGVTNQALVEYRCHEPGTGRIQVSRTLQEDKGIQPTTHWFYCIYLLGTGGGSPLYPETLQYYTMILQRPRIIGDDAGFEPRTSAPAVWRASK